MIFFDNRTHVRTQIYTYFGNKANIILSIPKKIRNILPDLGRLHIFATDIPKIQMPIEETLLLILHNISNGKYKGTDR